MYFTNADFLNSLQTLIISLFMLADLYRIPMKSKFLIAPKVKVILYQHDLLSKKIKSSVGYFVINSHCWVIKVAATMYVIMQTTSKT